MLNIKPNLSHLQADIPAGIAVALISIPLSLGIALASGAPLFAGLITGIVGGLIVAPLGGSALGISGAAAGLAIIAYTDIQQFGYAAFLVAVVLAGLLQIGLGFVRLGVIAYYFPSAVVNGMLSGIGLIILLKQIPHALGYDSDYEGDIAFSQADQYSSFTELAHMLNYITPGAVLIAVITLLILILWEQPTFKKLPGISAFQGVVLAIFTGCLVNASLRYFAPALALQPAHLVNLPVLTSLSDFQQQLIWPDITVLQHPEIYWTALTLAVVASLETLVTIDAVDKLDPYKRVTPVNTELMAQGFGNIICGLIGGLPLTQVVVRSSININSGAKTKSAAVIHGGVFLLVVVLLPDFINTIPLASLASILMVAGYKLFNPTQVMAMYRAGATNFIPYCATVLGLLFSDMLIGISIGFAIALVSILVGNYKNAFYFREAVLGKKTIIKLSEHVSFLNKANLLIAFERIPKGSEVVIDASRSNYIDYDVYEIIENFKVEAAHKNITLTLENLRGFGELPPLEFARAQTYESQQALTPTEVLRLLQEGNARFVNNLEANRNFLEQVNDTRQGQFPIAIILSCMDSRTSVELIFDQGLGDVFSARVAGNIVNDDMLGSMEYACKIAGSKLIVVLGHSHCGAIKGACAAVEMDHLTGLLAKIKPAVTAICAETGCGIDVNQPELVQKVADRNVQLAVAEIRERSPILAELEHAGEIAIYGAMYAIETGKVSFFLK